MLYNLYMEISAEIQKLFEQIKTVRRVLHKIPELSEKEFLTSDYIARFLSGLGYKTKTIGTGIYTDIKGSGGKTIALRCDIDALPIKEKSGETFASDNGCMHACGHDGHTAAMLGMAVLLKNARPKNNVRLIFQFGEEGSGGAEKMIEKGVLDGIDEIYAVHLDPNLEKGKMSTCYGAMFAGAVEFNILSYGKAAHCAEREKGTDVIKTLNYFLQNYSALNKGYEKNTLFHIGKITAGAARNIVADSMEIQCTLRFFNSDDQEDIMMRLARLLVEADNLYGTDSKLEILNVYCPLINSSGAVNKVKTAVPGVNECLPRFTAEDFGAYTERIDGCMVWLGTKDDKYSSPLHSDTFGFDEYALLYGVELFNRLVNN